MKATIDFNETLYRRLKIEAARRGRTIRDLVEEGVRTVLGMPEPTSRRPDVADADWYASLREYADNAGGKHDLAAMRRSVAEKRQPRT